MLIRGLDDTKPARPKMLAKERGMSAEALAREAVHARADERSVEEKLAIVREMRALRRRDHSRRAADTWRGVDPRGSRPVIVDASVAFKWIAQEGEGSEAALELIGREPLLAPTLLLAQVGNALWTKAVREQVDPEVSLEPELVGLGELVVVLGEAALAPQAPLTMARELGHPIYDCFYLAMADAMEQTLIMADLRFIRYVAGSRWRDLVRAL